MSNLTQIAIKESFKTLLNEQPLNKISVREIVEKCGINRNTFYYHYQDIPTLLKELILEETEELIRQYPSFSSLEECIIHVCEYAISRKRAIMHIYNSLSKDVFVEQLGNICENAVRTYIKEVVKVEETKNHEVIIRFIKCQVMGICMDWINNGMKEEELDDIKTLMELYKGIPDLLIERSKKN